MTKPVSITWVRLQSGLSSLLLLVLFLSVNASPSANSPAKLAEDRIGQRTEWMPAPASVRPTDSFLRDYALITVAGQRVARDISKQNRDKRSLIYNGLAPRQFGAPPATVRRRLIVTYQSVLYLSFLLSRPLGRGPPASA